MPTARNHDQVERFIKARETFAYRSMHGQYGGRIDPLAYGRLNPEHRTRYQNDVYGDRVAYVVWSYHTPIAWVRKDGSVYLVSQKFSPTTTQHQYAAEIALTGKIRPYAERQP